MTLLLQRTEQNQLFTAGTLYATGDTLADTTRIAVTLEPGTGHSHPAIPAGKYQIELHQSARFTRIMPFVINVPSRANIEIHFGNMPKDTLGCIIVGETTKFPYLIANSKATLLPIINRMIKDLDEQKSNSIEIRDVSAANPTPAATA